MALACSVKSSDEKSPSAGSMTTSRSVSDLRCVGGVVADQDGQHLVGHRRHRVELVALEQRETAIDHDEDVDAHFARHVDGQVGRQPAVDQHAPFEIHRREHARAPTGWRASP